MRELSENCLERGALRNPAMSNRQSPVCLTCGSTDCKLWTQATDGEYFTTQEIFSFYRCNNCQCLFIDPVPRDALAQIYPDTYYSYQKPKGSLIFKIKNVFDTLLIRKLVRDLKGETLRVLDVGGGAGWELNAVRNVDRRITDTEIIDMDPQAAEIATQNGHKYFCGRIEDYPAQTQFDLILFLSVIEHVEHPTAVLEKLGSLLSPQGIMVIKTPNYESLDERIFRRRNWAGYHCPRHWAIFNRESFENLARRLRFRFKIFSYTQGASFWAGSLLYFLHQKGIVKLSTRHPAVHHPLFAIFGACFAVFDYLRLAVGAKTSQMICVLEKITGE